MFQPRKCVLSRSIEQDTVTTLEVIAVDSLWSALSFKGLDRVLFYNHCSVSTVVAAVRHTHREGSVYVTVSFGPRLKTASLRRADPDCMLCTTSGSIHGTFDHTTRLLV